MSHRLVFEIWKPVHGAVGALDFGRDLINKGQIY
jgi:hypothetical protein